MNIKEKFLQAIGKIRKYKQLHTIEELLDLPNQSGSNYRKVHNVDLSKLDLSDFENMFSGQLPKPFMTTEEKIDAKK